MKHTFKKTQIFGMPEYVNDLIYTEKEVIQHMGHTSSKILKEIQARECQCSAESTKIHDERDALISYSKYVPSKLEELIERELDRRSGGSLKAPPCPMCGGFVAIQSMPYCSDECQAINEAGVPF